jgi:uncharacterized protein YgiM (DUF1202 family)
MKKNCWLMLGAMLATGAIAQDNTNALPEMPPPAIAPPAGAAPAPPTAATPAPAVEPAKATAPAKPKKHKAAAPEKAALTEPIVTLVPGPAEVAVSNVNIRGQAGLKGEVVTRLTKGDPVTVLGQINLDKHRADEPAQWAKIACPTNVQAWINTAFVDATNKTVLPKKLNLRAGPGENYSVLGALERGTPVNEITTKDNWMQIELPTNAYAFVAAMYLKQEAPATPVAEISAAPVEQAPPPPPRIVAHEGLVRHVTSPIAPTEYELYDPTTRRNIDYLYPSSPNLNLKHYDGWRIVVTGEEGLAERWKHTPVLTVQSIQVISTNVAPQHYAVSPRGGQHR